MRIIASHKKQKRLSLAQKYKLYLNERPESKEKLSNTYNLFDDLDTANKTMMREAKSYILIRQRTI